MRYVRNSDYADLPNGELVLMCDLADPMYPFALLRKGAWADERNISWWGNIGGYCTLEDIDGHLVTLSDEEADRIVMLLRHLGRERWVDRMRRDFEPVVRAGVESESQGDGQ